MRRPCSPSIRGQWPPVGRGWRRLPKAVVSVRHVSAPVAPLSSIFLLAFVGQLGAPAYRSSQPSAPCSTDQHQDERRDHDPDQRRYGGSGGRGVSLMVLPEASWLRWSNSKGRNEAQGPKGAEGPYDRCCGHLRPCCARAASSRLIRSSTSLWS